MKSGVLSETKYQEKKMPTIASASHLLHEPAEPGNQSLSQCEREDELGPNDEHFWSETLEEGAKAFVLDDLANDGRAAELVLEVLVLDAGLATGTRQDTSATEAERRFGSGPGRLTLMTSRGCEIAMEET